jgi:hypothetical protein
LALKYKFDYFYNLMTNFGLHVKYLVHLLKSNNRHGIHSPFVYTLLDKVIYDFSVNKVDDVNNNQYSLFNANMPQKVYRLIYRLVKHFKPQQIYWLNKQDGLIEHYIESALPNTSAVVENAPGFKPDLLIAGSATVFLGNYGKIEILSEPQTWAIVSAIHGDKTQTAAWALLCAKEEFTVTIDLFWIGLIFFKRAQVKEHFKLRF